MENLNKSLTSFRDVLKNIDKDELSKIVLKIDNMENKILEERWRIWAEVCKHIPKGTEQSDLIHKIIFENYG